MQFSSKQPFHEPGVGASRPVGVPGVPGAAPKADPNRAARKRELAESRLRATTDHEHTSPLIARCLIAATIIVFPLQEQLPTIAGFSIMYVMFVILLAYAVLFRPYALLKSIAHPVFLISYGWLLSGFIMESIHNNASDQVLIRVAQMIFGGVMIASLCQDRSMIRAAAYGYILAGLWLSVLLLRTGYGTLRGAGVSNFVAASALRARVYEDTPLQNNLNALAFIAAQGAVVALALALTDKSVRGRYLHAGMAFICALGAFMPLSRSGIVTLVVSSLVVLMSYKGQKTRAIGLLIFLGIAITILAPDAAFSRLSFSANANSKGRMEGRARIYTAAAHHFPEYAVSGVGAGNFWESWSAQSKFGSSGAHNSFVQVTIYWGVVALALFLAMLWRAYKCLPKDNRDYALTLVLYGIAISLVLRLMSSHTLHAKEYSLGLGLLVGARYAIINNAFYQKTKEAPSEKKALVAAP